MTASPILFSGDMVRAILAGAKTQTRRVVKPQPEMEMDGEICPDGSGGWDWIPVWPEGHRLAGRVLGYGQCPFGQPGDLLWVRETWAQLVHCAIHRATSTAVPAFWRPSIHMPRRACRLVLEVLEVRVERVQDITEEGAKAEGVVLTNKLPDGMEGLFRPRFVGLWDSIYSSRGLGWHANPWVWVVKFKVVAKTHSEAQKALEER